MNYLGSEMDNIYRRQELSTQINTGFASPSKTHKVTTKQEDLVSALNQVLKQALDQEKQGYTMEAQKCFSALFWTSLVSEESKVDNYTFNALDDLSNRTMIMYANYVKTLNHFLLATRWLEG